MNTLAMWNADDICRTRLCIVVDCPDEALTSHAVCAMHDRQVRAGVKLTLHEPTQLEPTLICRGPCKRWLPDAEFALANKRATDGGPRPDRRGRSTICVACSVKQHVRDFNERTP